MLEKYGYQSAAKNKTKQHLKKWKRRNERVGKFPGRIEKNDHLSIFQGSLSLLNKRGKKFTKPS